MFPASPKTKIMDSEICSKYFLHFVLFNVFRILKNKGHHSMSDALLFKCKNNVLLELCVHTLHSMREQN